MSMRQGQPFTRQREHWLVWLVAGLLLGAGLLIAAPAVPAAELVNVGYFAAMPEAVQHEAAPTATIGEYAMGPARVEQAQPAFVRDIGEYAAGPATVIGKTEPARHAGKVSGTGPAEQHPKPRPENAPHG